MTGCVTSGPLLSPPAGDRVTVFVPGYRGSILKRASDGQTVWLTPGQAIFGGKASLALPFEGEHEGRRYGTLEPGGPLTRLLVIPALIDVQIYQPWLEFGAARLPGFLPFGYDWRRDIRESGQKLCARLAELPPHTRFDIVAHSMGGLVALQCLFHGPPEVVARVDRVVFAGTPFRGGPSIYDDLHRGTESGLDHALLPAEALLTFPSAWELAPKDPDFFVDPAGQPVKVAAYDADTWVRRGWGPFADASIYGDPAYRAQLERMIAAHHDFWSGLVPPPELKWKALAVIGSGRATVSKQRVHADGSFDFDHPVEADGDGTVLSSSALPFEQIRHSELRTTVDHVQLLNASEVQEQIAAFLHAPAR